MSLLTNQTKCEKSADQVDDNLDSSSTRNDKDNNDNINMNNDGSNENDGEEFNQNYDSGPDDVSKVDNCFREAEDYKAVFNADFHQWLNTCNSSAPDENENKISCKGNFQLTVCIRNSLQYKQIWQ